MLPLGQTIALDQLTTEQRTWLDAGAGFLAPVIDRVCSFGSIEHAVEQHALELGLRIAFLRSDRDTGIRIGPVLERVSPLSMAYVEGVLRRQYQATNDLTLRLRNEHQDSWDAKIASIRIEAYILERPERAAISALAMIQSAPTDRQEEIGKVLFDLSETLPDETAANIDGLLEDVLPLTSRIPLAVRIRQAIRNKNIDEAEQMLASMPGRDDPVALQFQAQIFLQRGQKHEARLAIERACETFSTPGLLELSADLASEEGDWRAVADMLRRVLTIVPADAKMRKKLAHALIQAERFLEAAEEFVELSRIEPEDMRHRFNRAAALRRAGSF